MYVPPHFIGEPSLIADLVKRNPFCSLITPCPSGLKISHLPVIYDQEGGTHGKGVLFAHLAKANGHWKSFDSGEESLVVVMGPHAYISSTWYEQPSFVPTWNYAAVHLYGRPEVLAAAESSALLRRLIETFESEGSGYDYEAAEVQIEKQLGGIVAFKIDISHVEAKFKMSQNRSAVNRGKIIDCLERGSLDEQQVAAFMLALVKQGE